jgi:hypothetical protein
MPLQVSVSCRPGTPTYKLQVKKKEQGMHLRVVMCPAALDPTSQPM